MWIACRTFLVNRDLGKCRLTKESGQDIRLHDLNAVKFHSIGLLESGKPLEESMPTTKRAAHRPSRKQEVIDAAIEVYAAHGPLASIADVAQRCAMSPASIYYHFPTRDDLLAAAVNEAARRMELHTQAATREHGDRLTTADAVKVVWEWAVAHPDEARLLFVWSAPGAGAVREARQSMVDHYVTIAQRRMSQTENVSALDIQIRSLAARTYVSNAMGISEEWNAGRSIGGEKERDKIIETLISTSERILNET
jgi:AcrR family transcriptional regulator